MKGVAIVLATIAAIAAICASSASSQEPPLDLGMNDLAQISCRTAVSVAEDEGLKVKWCRVYAINPGDNEAFVVAGIKTDYGKFRLEFNYYRSLWVQRTFKVTSE